MMKTKSLLLNVAISLVILVCGIVIGKFLPSTKPQTPKITKYVYSGEINTGCKTPIPPLKYRISKFDDLNKIGAVPNVVTAYEISNAIFIRAFGKDKINYSTPFRIELQDGYIWSIEAQSLNTPLLLFYNIRIDKRNGSIDSLFVENKKIAYDEN